MSSRGSRSAAVRASSVRLRCSLRSALRAITDAPAMVLTDRLDVVATNRLGSALLAPVMQNDRVNLARFLFLEDERSMTFYPEWDRVADEHVGRLRAAAMQHPHDPVLHRLVGELSTHSREFRARWPAERSCPCRSPRLVISHPLVGVLELAREDLAPTADQSLTLRICTAETGSASDERLRILASWSQEPPEEHAAPTEAHRDRENDDD